MAMDAQGLGRYLRESREARELTLEDAEQALRIRKRTLEAFEQGDFDIPDASTVQIRGFLGNYARYLGLDEERLLEYYEVARQDEARRQRRGLRPRKRRNAIPEPRAARRITDTDPALPVVPPGELAQQRRARRTNLVGIFVTLLVGVAALAVVAFVLVQLTGFGQEPIVVNPEVPVLLAQSPEPVDTRVPTFTPLPALFAATSVRSVDQSFSGSGVLVTIEALQRTWLQLSTDGVEQFVGIMRPGDVIEFPALREVAVTSSNAEALLVVWNGQQQGVLGGRGQKVDLIFTEDDMSIRTGPGFEPTSEFTATPIPTSAIDVGALIAAQTPSATPGPSPTASDTPIPSDTPTITPTPSDTPTITLTPSITPTPSDTPTITPTPTATLTPTLTLTPSPTAILPPRVTQEGLPMPKEG